MTAAAKAAATMVAAKTATGRKPAARAGTVVAAEASAGRMPSANAGSGRMGTAERTAAVWRTATEGSTRAKAVGRRVRMGCRDAVGGTERVRERRSCASCRRSYASVLQRCASFLRYGLRRRCGFRQTNRLCDRTCAWHRRSAKNGPGDPMKGRCNARRSRRKRDG